MTIDYSAIHNFLDNFYNILRDNSFKVFASDENHVILKSPCNHQIKATTTPLYEKNTTLFKVIIETELAIHIPNAMLEQNRILSNFININYVYDLKNFLDLISNYIKSVKNFQKTDFKTFTLHFNLFNVITKDEDVSSFLSSVSNQLKNGENVQKILPFLDYIAIEKSIHSIVSFNHGTNSVITNRIIFSPAEKLFQEIYKDLFGRVRYTWDINNNLLTDNYYSESSYIDPRKYSAHEILDSKIWFEQYISNKPDLINLYSLI